MRRAGALALAALLSSCIAASPTAPQAPSASSTQTARPSLTATPTAVAARYEEIELFTLQLQPVDIAVSESLVFVAEINMGARFSDVRSDIVVAPIGGGPATVVAGSETPPGTGIMGLTYNGALYQSRVADGPEGARSSGVFRVDSGRLVLVAGGNGPSASGGNGDGGPATAAWLQGPWGIAFSKTGDLYVAEHGDSRVRVVRTGVVETHAGNGRCADPQPGSARSAALCTPGLVAVDPNGVVYVAQRNGASWIARIDRTGALTTIGGTFVVGGMAVDAGGNLVAADANTGTVVRFPAAGVTSPPTVLVTNLGAVRALTVGADGSIYVVRSGIPSGSGIWIVVRLRPTG